MGEKGVAVVANCTNLHVRTQGEMFKVKCEVGSYSDDESAVLAKTCCATF